METIFYPTSFCPLLGSQPLPHQKPSHPSLLSKPLPVRPTVSSSSKKPGLLPQVAPRRSWFSHVHHGLAALALSLAVNFCPVPALDAALASEFDVLRDGPPVESYVVDDAGVLSRVTKSDLKRLLSDLESRKGLRVNFVTVRKLTSKADAFEYADQVLEKWYPSLEEGNNKGIVVLVTSQKEGAITGGPKFIQSVGEGVLDSIVSENLPGKDFCLSFIPWSYALFKPLFSSASCDRGWNIALVEMYWMASSGEMVKPMSASSLSDANMRGKRRELGQLVNLQLSCKFAMTLV